MAPHQYRMDFALNQVLAVQVLWSNELATNLPRRLSLVRNFFGFQNWWTFGSCIIFLIGGHIWELPNVVFLMGNARSLKITRGK